MLPPAPRTSVQEVLSPPPARTCTAPLCAVSACDAARRMLASNEAASASNAAAPAAPGRAAQNTKSLRAAMTATMSYSHGQVVGCQAMGATCELCAGLRQHLVSCNGLSDMHWPRFARQLRRPSAQLPGAHEQSSPAPFAVRGAALTVSCVRLYVAGAKVLAGHRHRLTVQSTLGPSA
jgi:hypothetical protein